MNSNDSNIDSKVVHDFGEEWNNFRYLANESAGALEQQFAKYINPIDLNQFDKNTAIAADFGAGSGRWSSKFKPYFQTLYVLDPSEKAFHVLEAKFAKENGFKCLNESVGKNSLPDEHLDLAISLGVLHHLPDTALGIRQISRKVKPGGYFLCYLYYKLDDKPFHYRALHQISELLRRIISRTPTHIKKKIASLIALLAYYPFAKFSKFLNKFNIDTQNIPLHQYSNMSFQIMANDALDRFGTSLEKRFDKLEIIEMLKNAEFDLQTLHFSNQEPFWTFSVQKSI